MTDNKQALTMNVGGQPAGVVPRGFDEMWRFSQMVAKSGLAPQALKSPEQIMVALQQGMELGLMPMQALRGIAVVNGRPTMWGEVMLGLVRSRGHRFREWIEHDNQEGETAYCELTRADTGEKIVGQFSWQEAVHAGLSTKSGPWKQYPRRMLMWRARGYACRDGASDILSGFLSREEAQDLPPPAPDEPEIKDVTPEKPRSRVKTKADAKPKPEPETIDAAEHGGISDAVRELVDMIGAPNDEREGFEAWIVQDVRPMVYRLDASQADDFIAALEYMREELGLEYWGQPMLGDWRDTIRDAFTQLKEDYQ